MGTAYKWFDYFLNLLLVSTIIAEIVVFFFSLHNDTFSWLQNSQYIDREGTIITILSLISLVFAVLYFIGGISIFITTRGKNEEKARFGKGMMFRGILRGGLAFVFFFLYSLATSFFGLSLTNSPLPKVIVDEDVTDGFPLKDLKIVKLTVVRPQISGDSWTCDVTVQNNNATLTAADIFFSASDDETFQNRNYDVPPGQSKVINADNGNPQKPCDAISIDEASTLNK